MKKRTIIILVYMFFVFVSYFYGTYFCRGDMGDPYEDFTANVVYFVIPGLITAFVVNLGAFFVNQKVFLSSLIIAFLGGFIGPLIIHVIVLIESEPEAGMAYLFMHYFYEGFFLLAFIISMITKVVLNKLQQRKCLKY